jgi:potassium efflux system protein
MRYYLMSIGLIVPLIMALIMFDNLNDREFSARWAASALC